MRRLSPAGRSRGYTAIEVMLSLAILAIGAAGVISMQRGAIQGNVDARRLDMANSIAREWVERLRRDSMMWTLPNQANLANNNIGQAALLANIDGAWHLPNQRIGETATAAPNVPLNSPGFDILGFDQATLGTTNTNVMFCVNTRMTVLVPGSLIRAEVKVFYPRGLDVTPAAGFCAAEPPLADDTSLYHYVYAVSAVRKNMAP